MADGITTIAKGLSTIGRYAISRKEKERDLQTQLSIDKLKEEAWLRRLREQQEGQEKLKKMLMQQYKIREEEQTKRQAMQEATKWKRWQEEKGLKEAELEWEKSKFGEQKKAGYFKKTPKTEKDPAAERIKELSQLRMRYAPKYDLLGGIVNSGDPNMLKIIDKEIQKLGIQRYGWQPITTLPIPETPEKEPEVEEKKPWYEKFYDTAKEYVSPEKQSIKAQPKSTQKPPNERFIELQMQGKTPDEAFKILQQEYQGQF